ncbi:hypothetical protein, partial [Mesorhizobium sp. WSM4884]|uniref:hypothetical protein n=1 Tax=Mesorhizobium sp. WSM4884 TaxID=3038542 RepID=UPI0024181038
VAAAGARRGIKDGAEFVIPTMNRPEKANKEESVAPAALSFLGLWSEARLVFTPFILQASLSRCPVHVSTKRSAA